MESIDENFSDSDVKLGSESLAHLKETSKWAKFISIIGFIGLGLMLFGSLGLLVMSSNVSRLGGLGVSPAVVGVIYLALIVLYFFPIYYLYQFAIKVGDAADQKDSITMREATLFLKKHYRFIGIMTIVIISIYVLAFIGGIVAGGMR